MDKITIIISDDHTLVRQAWKSVLNADPRFCVIAQAGSAEETLELVKQLIPDVVMMDINLPGMNGIEATRQIRKLCATTKILGVSLQNQPGFARKMIQSGASGYVTKNSTQEEMFQAIIEIQQGRKYICEEIKNAILKQMVDGEDTKKDLSILTQRETQIIDFIKEGLSSKDIGKALALSAKTIELHRHNILKKLNMKNVAALVNFINNNNSQGVDRSIE